MPYLMFLAAGALGLIIMAALGAAHGGASRLGHRHHVVPGKVGHHALPGKAIAPKLALPRADAHGGALVTERASAVNASSARASQDDGVPLGPLVAPGTAPRAWQRALLPLISPLNWFSWMFGAGAAGMISLLLGVEEPIRAAVAIAGAIAFNWGVVKPVFKTVFHFASTPAGSLEACLFQEVEAVTSFNRRGEGLVRVTIDGRSEDVLARLSDAERSRPGGVRKGERLVIEEIDSRTSTCIVSRN